MNILLVAINAKYIHTNPAVYLLRANAGEFRNDITIREFTINQSPDDILQGILEEKPDFIGFSCYIWNTEMVQKLIPECKKMLPEAVLWLGGPEAEAGAERMLLNYQQLDGVMFGEGESVFPKLLAYYVANRSGQCNGTVLSEVPGIMFRGDSEIIKTEPSAPFNLDELVFPYDEAVLEQTRGKILYYESSRGCPFHCSYCLSSEDNHVRFRSVDKVKEDLKILLDAGIRQVKFVDRTFNCNHARMRELLLFMLEHDNGSTNFHFEIGGDLLTEEEIVLLQQFRPGAVQLEIGVQTTNPEVLKRIGRMNRKEELFRNATQLIQCGRQHVHLDLIAGLPGEDLQSFIRSFDEVYALGPHQLQLGFLKVLGNTRIHREAEEYGIKYRDYSPYEVLETAAISYRELLEIKQIEEMVEIYYNSGQFAEELKFLMNYLKRQYGEAFSAYRMYRGLAKLYFSRFANGMQSSRMARYELLLEYIQAHTEESMHAAVIQLAVFDCYSRERKKARPTFSLKNCGEQMVKDIVRADGIVYQKENHAEFFTIDIKRTAETGTAVLEDNIAIFDYGKRSPITENAQVVFYGPELFA